MSASVIPSTKNSWSAAPVRLASGSTAMDAIVALGGAEPARVGTPGAPVSVPARRSDGDVEGGRGAPGGVLLEERLHGAGSLGERGRPRRGGGAGAFRISLMSAVAGSAWKDAAPPSSRTARRRANRGRPARRARGPGAAREPCRAASRPAPRSAHRPCSRRCPPRAGRWRARPKSSSFTRPRSSIMTFPGLRSRWITSRSCAAASASAISAPWARAPRRAVPSRSASRGSPRDELHDDEVDAFGGLDVVDRADAGVIELGEVRPRDASAPAARAQSAARSTLEAVAAQPLVARAVEPVPPVKGLEVIR